LMDSATMRSELIGERHEPQGATIAAGESALGISFTIASKPFGDPQPKPHGI
jgi:hypothetical protein